MGGGVSFDPLPEVPHLRWPLRLTPAGHLAQVEQDTLEDVRQCVAILVATPVGARPLAPEDGVEDPTFGPGWSPVALRRAIEAQEDRAAVDVQVTPLPLGEERVQVTVDLVAEDRDDL
jgi:hypothetical protein